MCKIRLIKKTKGEISFDNQIHVSGQEFEIIDRPYYVVESEEDNITSFSFHYLDADEQKKKTEDGPFELFFGISTGRLYSLKIKTDTHIENIIWESLKDKIRNIELTSTIAENNLKTGCNVVKNIYFNKFELID